MTFSATQSRAWAHMKNEEEKPSSWSLDLFLVHEDLDAFAQEAHNSSCSSIQRCSIPNKPTHVIVILIPVQASL